MLSTHASPVDSGEPEWFNQPLPGAVETTLSLAARALGFPTVRINIVHQDLQHTIGFFGVGDLCPIDRKESFCDVVVTTGEWMMVPDATVDPRFAGLASVVSGEIGAYLGVPLFGTGWAGLDQLLWFPCDAIRLSRAMTAALGTEVGDTLIRAVTSMAHALEQRVVIDGIDTFDQARAAAALGCDRALGAVWGEARPAEAVDERYRTARVGAAPQGVR